MCNATCSESGKLLTIQPCGWYLKLLSERDRLAGVVQGMEGQSVREAEKLLKEQMENERLRQERDALLYYKSMFKQMQEGCDGHCALDECVCEKDQRVIDLKQERDALLKVRDELIDIAHGQTMFDEFNKRYTHSFMSDGEALWRLLGFDDKRPYIPEAEFNAAVQRFKEMRDDRV